MRRKRTAVVLVTYKEDKRLKFFIKLMVEITKKTLSSLWIDDFLHLLGFVITKKKSPPALNDELFFVQIINLLYSCYC